MSNYVILVDKNDDVVGTEEKYLCHLPSGKLHRAFTTCIFNNKNELLLTKRSNTKMLWSNCWDGTIASHPKNSENYTIAAERRMQEELGVTCKLEYLFKFEYHIQYENIGSENEMCGVLIGKLEKQTNYNKNEISKIMWADINRLNHELKTNIKAYCPWMIVALYLLFFSRINYGNIADKWNKLEFKRTLEESINYYFPNKNNWRFVE
ncbi:MAG: isopentenyl-diphosphate Delta-isomerase [Thaumarchaeota archaeon]|nr:isopentenyl-diphosphate Delta-isomerase [Nitrososphaerota archaeon]